MMISTSRQLRRYQLTPGMLHVVSEFEKHPITIVNEDGTPDTDCTDKIAMLCQLNDLRNELIKSILKD